MKGKVIIGTSGWNYKHWKGTFYPEDLKQKEWLEYYSGIFDSVELNNSFYSLPEEKTLENWKDTVKNNFRFSVKGSRYITHQKKLNDPEEYVINFIERVDVLKENLGPVLFQLPPNMNYDREKLENFVNALPDGYEYTIEFRNKTWWNDEAYGILKDKNIAFCIFELGELKSPKEVTADYIYIRLHGKEVKYKGSYGKNDLSGWAGAFGSWLDKVKKIYCYFDNDENGYAAQNAKELKEMIS